MMGGTGDPAPRHNKTATLRHPALPAREQTTPDARVAAEVVFGYNIPQPHSWYSQDFGVMTWLVFFAPATPAVSSSLAVLFRWFNSLLAEIAVTVRSVIDLAAFVKGCRTMGQTPPFPGKTFPLPVTYNAANETMPTE